MINTIFAENCLETMRLRIDNRSIDLVVTSPPYDDLRVYKGFHLDIPKTAFFLNRVVKPGGVVVWIQNDKTQDGDETLSSFKAALEFRRWGFNLWDTMIWHKTNPTPTDGRIPRYVQSFEYMFIFSKGRPKTFNPYRVPTKNAGLPGHGNNYPARRENGEKSNVRVVSQTPIVRDTRIVHNVVDLPVNSTKSKLAREHPATFPEHLAEFHIKSWSNVGDVVYDPFCGSGTTCKVAKQLGRNYIGSDISEEYANLARRRIAEETV